MKQIKALILDMDGVLWRQSEPIGDLPAIFSTIRSKGLLFSLATNNATLEVDGFIEKLAGLGVEVQPSQVVTSSLSAASYLKNRFPNGGQVFIIGEKGLRSALHAQGFEHAEQEVLAVIAAMDRQFSYKKLAAATQHIRHGAIFIGTNPDRTYPTPYGLLPGAGAILASIQAATDVEPVIIGKPAPEMYRTAMRRMNTLPEETLVIGDRLETDIAGAQKLGCPTGVVLSGVSTQTQVEHWEPAVDMIAADLTALLNQL